MTKIGTHIDRKMYNDLQQTTKLPDEQAQASAIEKVITKNLADGPKDAHDRFAVGEYNAMKKFINTMPEGDMRKELGELLEVIPRYSMTAIRAGQAKPASTHNPTEREFYHGNWVRSEELSNTDIIQSLSIKPDGSWSMKGSDLDNAKGEGFDLESAEWMQAGSGMRLLALQTDGNNSMALIGANINNTDMLTMTGAEGFRITLLRKND